MLKQNHRALDWQDRAFWKVSVNVTLTKITLTADQFSR